MNIDETHKEIHQKILELDKLIRSISNDTFKDNRLSEWRLKVTHENDLLDFKFKFENIIHSCHNFKKL